jgi:hypothetical protein
MIRKTKYPLILLLAITLANVSAQNSQVIYYMNLPQNHMINPALRPSNSLYIGLPVISGISLNINNNFANFSDVFRKGQTGDSVISIFRSNASINNFLSKIKEKNSIETRLTYQLFGLGFSVGEDSYVFLDINERVEGNAVVPRDLFELALKGNSGFLGRKIDLSSLRGDLKYYREAGLGFSKNFTKKLRIGIKGKLLFGIAGASIDNRSLGITVKGISLNDNYSDSLNADINVNISGPVEFNVDANHNIKVVFDKNRFKTSSGISDFILGNKNIGLGFDVGAVYDISDKLIISAAVTDIGYIKWKKDITNLEVKSNYKFSGVNLVDVINGIKTFEEVGNKMVDSLKTAFVFTSSHVPYTSHMPFGVTLGASYNLTRQFSLGLLSYSRIFEKKIQESLTLSGNLNLGNSLSTTLSYTFDNYTFDNLGAGLAFRVGIFQLYMLADRIPMVWNRIKSENNSPILLPANWNNFNLRFGLNLTFGNKSKRKSDRPMVTVD